MQITITSWDVVLAIVVCLQATVLAYMHHPKWKAFLITLPIPFTLVILSLSQSSFSEPVSITNITGTIVLLAFTNAVRLLAPRIAIIPAILVSAAGYCLIGAWLMPVLPRGEMFFWLACGGSLLTALVVIRLQPPREEPGHRTSLPVWIKAPLILCVVAFLVVIKKYLGGFMSMFPMVGVIAAYEARYSLWTMSRQIPVLMFTTVPMMMMIRMAHLHWRLPLVGALALGWGVFLLLLFPLTRDTWRTPAMQAAPEVVYD